MDRHTEWVQRVGWQKETEGGIASPPPTTPSRALFSFRRPFTFRACFSHLRLCKHPVCIANRIFVGNLLPVRPGSVGILMFSLSTTKAQESRIKHFPEISTSNRIDSRYDLSLIPGPANLISESRAKAAGLFFTSGPRVLRTAFCIYWKREEENWKRKRGCPGGTRA